MMEKNGSLGRLADEVESWVSSGPRRAGGGDFPITTAGDAHGRRVASVEKQEEPPIDQFICQDLFYGLFV